jgi:hypothetical protein
MNLLRRLRRALRGRLSSTAQVYADSAPHPQNALDIFEGEWASQLPEPFEALRAGATKLFDDDRVRWGEEQAGGFEGMSVLDLGPLEGGHPYMFEQLGAGEVVSIEANTRAYLRCLVTKELLGLRRVAYHCGDFMAYLRTNTRRFDLVNASGVLYHQENPAELLALIARTSDRALIWTHYYDPAPLQRDPWLRQRLSRGERRVHEGFEYTAYRQEYREALRLPGFCGGRGPHSYWLTAEDIRRGLRHFGFDDVRTAFDDPLHVNGPSFSLFASRPRALKSERG